MQLLQERNLLAIIAVTPIISSQTVSCEESIKQPAFLPELRREPLEWKELAEDEEAFVEDGEVEERHQTEEVHPLSSILGALHEEDRVGTSIICP